MATERVEDNLHMRLREDVLSPMEGSLLPWPQAKGGFAKIHVPCVCEAAAGVAPKMIGEKYPCDPCESDHPEGLGRWMRTWTEAQRRRYNMQKKLMEAGSEVRGAAR